MGGTMFLPASQSINLVMVCCALCFTSKLENCTALSLICSFGIAMHPCATMHTFVLLRGAEGAIKRRCTRVYPILRDDAMPLQHIGVRPALGLAMADDLSAPIDVAREEAVCFESLPHFQDHRVPDAWVP